MTNIDQFESVFKAADKRPYIYEPVQLDRGLVVTDLSNESRRSYVQRVQAFFQRLHSQPVEWHELGADDFHSVAEMLERIEAAQPDFLISYRNLHFPATDHPYSLGVHLDVMTQATTYPVLVTPHPTALEQAAGVMDEPRTVMAITDHLSQDHRLVSFAAQVTPTGGDLWLTHVEDEATFNRYMRAIERIATIDTDDARDAIHKQLLKQPAEYIESCRKVLAERETINVKSEVVTGCLLDDYKRLVQSHDVSLLVMNTKDEQQLAMHGMAYPLTIELRDTPMMLI